MGLRFWGYFSVVSGEEGSIWDISWTWIWSLMITRLSVFSRRPQKQLDIYSEWDPFVNNMEGKTNSYHRTCWQTGIKNCPYLKPIWDRVPNLLTYSYHERKGMNKKSPTIPIKNPRAYIMDPGSALTSIITLTSASKTNIKVKKKKPILNPPRRGRQ